MASAFTHAAAALALGTAFRDPGKPARFWMLGAACAVFPDLDAIGYYLGVPYGSIFGHRGFTHSIVFAALLASAALMFAREEQPGERRRSWLFFFLATCSHGMLDTITSGGGGVAFFAPFDNQRYRLPWELIEVSPMSIRRFFTERGVRVIRSELAVVWVPAAFFAVFAILFRRARGMLRERPRP
jgi:inner membrane protein